MGEDEVNILAKEGYYEGAVLDGKVEETHISYVILSDRYAFKIKKPVKFSFLDFSTLSKRKKYCARELSLNQRFSHIYLDVLAIYKEEKTFTIGTGRGKVMDYAVRMKKMDPSKKMDRMLQEGIVRKENIRLLADEILKFHRKAQVIKSRFNKKKFLDLFNDIEDVQSIVRKFLGEKYVRIIRDAVQWNDSFVHRHIRCLQQRSENGFIRDLHGDLHSGNIFLYKHPVLFDCIEFSDSFRRIDVLNEIAFLCMDLEAYGEKELSELFLSHYRKRFACINSKEEEELFLYYKCYRANVRTKIHALGADQEKEGEEFREHKREIKLYLRLMKGYMNELNF